MPAAKKRPGSQQRQDRVRTTLALLPSRPDRVVPVPPSGLLVSSKALWAEFWASDVSLGVSGADVSLVERWIVRLDEWRRAMSGVRRERLVAGSMGQPVMNPLAAYAAQCEAAVRDLERQMGVGTKNRLDLGIAAATSQKSIAELNAMATVEGPHGDEGVIDVEEAEVLGEFTSG